MKTITLSESFKTLIERNKNRSKICKALSIADRLPLSIHNRSIDYLTTRPNGIISYLPKGRELKLTDNGQWSREGREEGRAGRMLPHFFSQSLLQTFSSADIEIFSNIVSGYESELNYTIVKGWDIVNLYDEKSPIETIARSCMQNVSYWEDSEGDEYSRVQLYALNPDRVECLVFRDEQGRLIGRVLKWLTDCGNIVIDRTYAKETIREQVHNICALNGWYKKEFDTWDYKDKFIYKGEQVTKEFKVTLKNEGETAPYLDCFTYGLRTPDGLVLSNTRPHYTPHLLGTQTEGKWQSSYFVYCPISNYHSEEYNWKHSDFYNRPVYISETYNTNLGLVYGNDFIRITYIKHKGKLYEDYNHTTICTAPAPKGKYFKRNDLNCINGVEIYNPDGSAMLIPYDKVEEIRKSYAIVRNEAGDEIERVEVVKY